jgi:hypothetical protein
MTATKDIPFTVIKKNYFGVEDTYTINYFKHSKENLRLANVNNHITAGYVAVTNSKEFIAVAKDNAVLSNFAFCPLNIDYGMVKGFTVSLIHLVLFLAGNTISQHGVMGRDLNQQFLTGINTIQGHAPIVEQHNGLVWR